MCAIIELPIGSTFNAKKLTNASFINSDGFGLMYINPETSKLEVVKEYIKDNTLATKKLLELVEEHKNNYAVLHLRYATHGTVDADNCHPFPILTKEKDGRDIYMMHNGVISITSSAEHDKGKSDTALFAEYIVRPVLKAAPELLHTHAFHQLVSDYTSGSRLIFLDEDGRVVRTGKWETNEDCAVSNNNYFSDPVTSYKSSYQWTGGPKANEIWCYLRQKYTDRKDAVTYLEYTKNPEKYKDLREKFEKEYEDAETLHNSCIPFETKNKKDEPAVTVDATAVVVTDDDGDEDEEEEATSFDTIYDGKVIVGDKYVDIESLKLSDLEQLDNETIYDIVTSDEYVDKTYELFLEMLNDRIYGTSYKTYSC